MIAKNDQEDQKNRWRKKWFSIELKISGDKGRISIFTQNKEIIYQNDVKKGRILI